MLSTFLRGAAQSLQALAAVSQADGLLPAVAVLGNEGGDFDSVAGSVMTAFAMSAGLVALPDACAAADGTAPVVVPFINFSADDLALRGDIYNAFKTEDVDSTALLSAIDEPGKSLLRRCRWVVAFDHNRLAKQQQDLQSRVVAVIDHHTDEGLNPDATPRVVQPCGSACSLLVRLMSEKSPSDVMALPSKSLLLAPILLDTANFDPLLKKTTPNDLRAASLLLGHSEWAAAESSPVAEIQAQCHEYFGTLTNWKNDVSALTIPQSLRRDYKAFEVPLKSGAVTHIGVASWLESYEAVLQRFGAQVLAAELASHVTRNELDAVVIMFAHGSGASFRREALWFVKDKVSQLCDVLRAYFAGRASSAEGFEVVAGSSALLAAGSCDGCVDSAQVGIVTQSNIAVSRKQLVPALLAFAVTM